MVSNAELLKLLTEFKQEQQIRHDDLTKANEDGRRELNDKLDKFVEKLDSVASNFVVVVDFTILASYLEVSK